MQRMRRMQPRRAIADCHLHARLASADYIRQIDSSGVLDGARIHGAAGSRQACPSSVAHVAQ